MNFFTTLFLPLLSFSSDLARRSRKTEGRKSEDDNTSRHISLLLLFSRSSLLQPPGDRRTFHKQARRQHHKRASPCTTRYRRKRSVTAALLTQSLLSRCSFSLFTSKRKAQLREWLAEKHVVWVLKERKKKKERCVALRVALRICGVHTENTHILLLFLSLSLGTRLLTC